MAAASRPIAYVMNGYGAVGSAFMDYHVGWTLQQRLGYDCKIVGKRWSSPFAYPVEYPCVTMDTFTKAVRDEDVVIAAPGVSTQQLGSRLRGRKVMYVQGILHPMIDGFFDHYVYVSDFVKRVYSSFALLGDTVIPGFVTSPPATRPWRERPRERLLVLGKVDFQPAFRRFREAMRVAAPDLRLETLDGATWERSHLERLLSKFGKGWTRVGHDDLLRRLGEYRYVAVLSSCEGFGLLPLEAMSVGCTVVAFHGGGGLEYMRSGENCVTMPFPKLQELAKACADVIKDEERASQIASAATADSRRFGVDAFLQRWEAFFRAHGFARD